MSLISYLTDVHFDFGALALLPETLSRLAIRSPFLVTDPGVRTSPVFDRVAARLPPLSDAAIFASTPPNPTEAAVEEATARFKGASCDGIIALGGGSPLDLAKAVALMATHAGSLVDYAAVEGGTARIGPAVAPLVAVPTTAGTGSEVGRATVIVMSDGRKLGVISPHLIPRAAICDPELTFGMPPALTAGTGMDAIAHCVEALLSPRVNPPADAIALDGLQRGSAHIERAWRDGNDAEARWHMMMASLEGGLAFQKGLGAIHALSHPLGTLRQPLLHHGTLNAVFLPHVLRFNEGHVGDKYERMRQALALSEGADLAVFFTDLTARLGLPRNLREMGVSKSVLPLMARMAEKDLTSQTNPRAADQAAYLDLLEDAYGE
jgi:alcohol dehydrogenase class IV